MRIALACGSFFFVLLGAPVGILFARRDFLSAFITCFVPIIILYYPLMLLGVNLGKDGHAQPDDRPLGRQRRARRSSPGSSCRRSSSIDRSAGAVGRDARSGPADDRVAVDSRGGGATMRILDRERYWAFFKAYVICFVALVGLYVVIDAFSNFDEFAKRADGRGRDVLDHGPVLPGPHEPVLRPALRRHRHDGGDLHRHLDAEEQRAAGDARRGISTQRVIRPVWISAVIVSVLAVVNQELIMPPLAEELQKRTTTTACSKVNCVYSRYDSQGILIHGREADRADADGPAVQRHAPGRDLRRDPRARGEAGPLHPARPSHVAR